MSTRCVRHLVALLCGAIVCIGFAPRVIGQSSGGRAPRFTVDPSWPLEMPNKWILGAVTGVFVDSKQHVWLTHLPETLTEEETSAQQKPPIATCCVAAPPVIEFDAQGKVVQGWGQGSMDDTSNWPRNPHGIFVDHNDFVWIGTYMHHRVMKFTRDGKLVLTIGQYDRNAGSNDTTLLGGPSGIWVDPKTNEVYISDGYRNRRVIVFDGATGKYLRHWGAYGEKPDDAENSIRRRWSMAPCRSSSRRRTASPGRKTARSTWPIGAATASRCSTTRASFSPRK